jgi:antitoxin (DNA-binding transcriptional repressor) of toxin-antitoxin stability system
MSTSFNIKSTQKPDEPEVIITKDGKPLVKLVPVATPKPKPLFGSAKDLISMSEDFDAPLDDFQEYSS